MCVCPNESILGFVLFKIFLLFIYLFLAVLGLCSLLLFMTFL